VDPYALVEVNRRSPMLWLVLAFAALVIVFGRLRERSPWLDWARAC
jgi:hypothetical protein